MFPCFFEENNSQQLDFKSFNFFFFDLTGVKRTMCNLNYKNHFIFY